eukprot:177167_1
MKTFFHRLAKTCDFDDETKEFLVATCELGDMFTPTSKDDNFIPTLEKLISNLPYVNDQDSIDIQVTALCTSMDLFFSDTVKLKHPQYSSCIHNKFQCENIYIEKLLHAVTYTLTTFLSHPPNAILLSESYNPKIECLKSTTFCHSCCIELITHFGTILNIINYPGVIYSLIALNTDINENGMIKNPTMYPIDIIIDIIRNVLSFGNVTKYIFKFRPDIWQPILRFWKVICFTNAKYGDLFVIDPQIINDFVAHDRYQLGFINETVMSINESQTLSSGVVSRFTTSIVSTVKQWKKAHWKYLFDKQFDLLNLIGICSVKYYEKRKMSVRKKNTLNSQMTEEWQQFMIAGTDDLLNGLKLFYSEGHMRIKLKIFMWFIDDVKRNASYDTHIRICARSNCRNTS